MIFICSVFPQHTNELLAFNRLYAFPRKPQPPPADGFCLLDSGAYGLSQRGQTMDARYLKLLAHHYVAKTSENVFGIMPDEYLNPSLTRQRWNAWRRAGNIPVVPVVQFPKEKRLDLFSMLKQLEGYIRQIELIPRWQGKSLLCISNPALMAYDCKPQAQAIQMFRASAPEVWLHNLGAGWSPDDIRRWRDLDCFDSIDSISYYIDAQAGFLWGEDARKHEDGRDWKTLAALNAWAAQQYVRT